MPDGSFVTGRDFDKTPASITGYNTGEFACEMLGNFDTGHDIFRDPQEAAMLKLAHYFDSKRRYIRFHRENASKTCPGTSIDKTKFMEEVSALDTKTATSSAAPAKPSVHWAQKYFDFLQGKGITINETRFDDKISRGEVFALMARVMGLKE